KSIPFKIRRPSTSRCPGAVQKISSLLWRNSFPPNLFGRRSRTQRHTHPLADARRRLPGIQLHDAFQRPHVVELQRLLEHGAAVRVPIGYANHFTPPTDAVAAVVLNKSHLPFGDPAGE